MFVSIDLADQFDNSREQWNKSRRFLRSSKHDEQFDSTDFNQSDGNYRHHQ
jgi:hypothetical protein